MRPARTSIWLVAAIGVAAAAILATVGAAGTAATKQRIAIEERGAGDYMGTFKLLPLTPGPVKADSGTTAFSIKPRGTATAFGQRVATYAVTETLTGKRGVIEIRGMTKSTNAGGGYLAESGPWSITGGTKAYARLEGGGRHSGVLTPKKVIFTRYEGYVTLP